MSSAPGAGTAGAVILEGRELEKTYEMGDIGLKVLRGVSVEVRKGEILAIQGPSGAGKSTLLHLLGLLDEPDRGQVLYRGENLLDRSYLGRAEFRNENVGFVFQFYHLFPDLTALENVCLPKMVGLSGGEYRAKKDEIEERAKKLLGLVGLAERMEHRPAELSGGERQRVAIARALMNEPEIVLCDEPTGNLDQKRAQEILDVIWKLNAETGQTFVLVTHDNELARRAHRKIHVVDGVLAEAGAPSKPRGFAETRYRLRGRAASRDFSRSPFLMGWFVAAGPLAAVVIYSALIALLPAVRGFGSLSLVVGYGALVIQFAWLFSLHERFHEATRRGHSGSFAAFAHLIPLVGFFVPFFVHLRPLREADHLLKANHKPGLRLWRTAALFWPIAFYLQIVLMALGGFEVALLAYTTQALAQGFVAAWIQSLHNAFYDRMREENAERTG